MNRATRRFIKQHLLTTQEASALSGIRAVTLQKRVARGQLDAVVKGRTYLFDRADIESLPRHGARNLPPVSVLKDGGRDF